MLLAHLILIISHYPRTHKHGPNCTVDTQERDCGVELVCLPPQDGSSLHFCGECTTHEQCTARPELMCRVEFNGRRLCVHKDMWPPDGRDWWGFALAFLACAISAGAGGMASGTASGNGTRGSHYGTFAEGDGGVGGLPMASLAASAALGV